MPVTITALEGQGAGRVLSRTTSSNPAVSRECGAIAPASILRISASTAGSAMPRLSGAKSEYGGIWWNPQHLDEDQQSADDPGRADSWGPGRRVESVEAWHERFEGLTRVLLEDPGMFGYCYTQLTDTFQEESGLYDFDREPKFDIARIRAIQTTEAAYERPEDNRGTTPR